MSGPHNRKAFEEGQAVRCAVKAIMAARSPLQRPLTAKEINARLPPHLRLRLHDDSIRWHVRAIYRETEAESANTDTRAAGMY